MTPDQFESLARRLERQAVAHPVLYRAQLCALAVLGYAYILVLLLAALSLVGLLVAAVVVTHTGWFVFKAAKLVAVVLVFTWAIARSLVVRIPPPPGIPLERERVPRLSALVDELRAAVAAPAVHRLIVTDDFNAALAMIPLWGYLGPTRNYLILGLPLMQALAPEHFKAVLAHELGHLSGNHGRFGSWVYRVRETWGRLHQDLLARESHGRFLVEGFLKWYAPRFDAWSLVLARSQEYQADRCAAEVTSPQAAGEALIHIELRGKIESQVYWPKLFAATKSESHPPAHAFRNLGAALRDAVPEVPGERWLEAALDQLTIPTHTHPALGDRLRAMAFPLPVAPSTPRLPAVLEQTAAEQFLGPVEAELVDTLDRAWREHVQPRWSAQHKEAEAARRRFEELEEKARGTSLARDETVERALLSADFGDRQRALELLQEALVECPDFTRLHFDLGKLMLEAGDAAGVERLETAMHLEPQAVAPVCSRVFAWYRQRGDAASCQRWRERARALQREADQAIEERTVIKPDDRFMPHDLTQEQLQHVCLAVMGVPEVKAAYLARKEVEGYRHIPLYVLVMLVSAEITPQTIERLTDALSRCELRGEVRIVYLSEGTGVVPSGLVGVPGAALPTAITPAGPSA